MTKTTTIQIRVTPLEKRQMAQFARRAGLSLSAWMRHTLLKGVVLVAALLLTACGSPLQPSAAAVPVSTGPLVWACSGQSNADEICSHQMPAYATIIGSWRQGEPLSSWDAGTVLSDRLMAAVAATPPSALIWWQGESDVLDATSYRYLDKFRDLVARTRAAAKHPALPVLVVELGPKFRGSAVWEDLRTFTQTDAHAIWINTDDLAWDADGTHMFTTLGYPIIAARIAAQIKR